MMSSFFHTKVHPNDIDLTAVNTPLGVYEWLVMLMGLGNTLPIHQQCMSSTLHLIEDICHVYVDDIIIWSENVEEHKKHLQVVMFTLEAAKIYCNPKKCEFFKFEMDYIL